MILGKTQRLIIQYIKERGDHVFLGAGAKSGCLIGHTWEEVERSLARLVERGIVIEKKKGFYQMAGDHE